MERFAQSAETSGEHSIERGTHPDVIPEMGSIIATFRDKVIINEPFFHYPELTVEGAANYGDRSFILPGKTVVAVDNDGATQYARGLVDYYGSQGIGAKKYQFIAIPEGGSLLAAVLRDVSSYEDLRAIGHINIFAQSKESQEVFRSVAKRVKLSGESLNVAVRKVKTILGLPTLRATDVGSSWEKNDGRFLGGILNDEVMLRPYLERHGYEDLNMAFCVIREDFHDEGEWRHVIEKGGGSAFIKFSGSASGCGIKRVSSVEEVREFIAQHATAGAFILTEDLSREVVANRTVQFYITSQGDVQFEGLTQQVVDKRTGTVHQGNYLSSDSRDTVNGIADARGFALLKEAIGSIAGAARGTHLGVDLFETTQGLKVIEINGRMTGAIHPAALLDQLRVATDDREPIHVFSMNTIKPRVNIGSFQELTDVLEETLFSTEDFQRDGRAGAIPTLVRTLPGKVGMIFVGKDRDAVRDIAVQVGGKLGDNQLIARTTF